MCHELLCCFRSNGFDHSRSDVYEEKPSWNAEMSPTMKGTSNSPSLIHAKDDLKKPLPSPLGEKQEENYKPHGEDHKNMKTVSSVEENGKSSEEKFRSVEPSGHEEASKKSATKVHREETQEKVPGGQVASDKKMNFASNEEVSRKP
ncbi:hypothetical protein IHE45_05G129000 [Dioscorea alata]|uniref:Uncharacterized protein n=1 Tax=Dioscorea alata TaxID=55571 RepID=A0ACB7W4X5_DIOAL|nr:hypothetical protein IHE45_05G129000 [Dioscorea alata]